MAGKVTSPRATNQSRYRYVRLTFNHPVTDEELKQIQMQHGAVSAARTVGREAPRPDWYHADNGFTSRLAMDAQQGPLVETARDCLIDARGNVIDLGCGNGALVAKICEDRESLTPWGVDRNAVAVRHARKLFPQFALNFRREDIFDPAIWSGSQRYVLAILMAGWLTQVPAAKRTDLFSYLSAFCDRLLLYVYPSWSGESLEGISEHSSLEFHHSVAGVAGVVLLSPSR